MNLLIQEFKRCIRRAEFKIVFLIVFLISVCAFLAACYSTYGADLSTVRSAYEMTILQGPSTSIILSMLLVLLPLLAPIIYSDTLHNELKSGVYQSVLTRTNLRVYIWSKVITIFVVVFLTFFIPLAVNQILCFIAFPLIGYDSIFGFPPYDIGIQNFDPTSMLDLMRIQKPLLYNFMFMVMISFTAASIALLAYGTSFYIKKNRFALLAGVFLFITILNGGISLISNEWSLMSLLRPHSIGSGLILTIWLICFIGVGVLMIWLKTKDNELQTL